MDGWMGVQKKKNSEGHDYIIIKLGKPGTIKR
jgi:allantoicase